MLVAVSTISELQWAGLLQDFLVCANYAAGMFSGENSFQLIGVAKPAAC